MDRVAADYQLDAGAARASVITNTISELRTDNGHNDLDHESSGMDILLIQPRAHAICVSDDIFLPGFLVRN